MKITQWKKSVNKYLNEDETEEELETKNSSSLPGLNNPGLVDKLVDFIKTNPFPPDSKLHKFAEDNSIEPDEVEEYAYAMLTLILKGGKSKGKIIKVTPENESIGKKIEMEHVSWEGKSNSVLKRMQEIFVDKIRSDHGAETKTYYVDGVDFKEELKKEKQNEN